MIVVKTTLVKEGKNDHSTLENLQDFPDIMIIAGLGNPGTEYRNTRHNIGFDGADILARAFHTEFSEKRCQALLAGLSYKGERHLLVKPQTYMNLSGDSLVCLLEDRPSTDLIVIVDDISLPVGRIRLRPKGSDGGHNGLKSIIRHCGISFWRLRIGVGEPKSADQIEHDNIVSHVLGSISSRDRQIINHIFDCLPEIVVLILAGMGNKAMTKFNGRNFTDAEVVLPATTNVSPQNINP